MLRRAEAGGRVTITVGGRPVAELGPVARRPRFAEPESFARILRTPVDSDWQGELLAMRAEDADAAADYWTQTAPSA